MLTVNCAFAAVKARSDEAILRSVAYWICRRPPSLTAHDVDTLHSIRSGLELAMRDGERQFAFNLRACAFKFPLYCEAYRLVSDELERRGMLFPCD